MYPRQWGLGSADKAWALCLTYLGSGPAVSRSPLVGIHKDWLHPKRMGFNPSVLPGGWRNLVNPYFCLPKKKKICILLNHWKLRNQPYSTWRLGGEENDWVFGENHLRRTKEPTLVSFSGKETCWCGINISRVKVKLVIFVNTFIEFSFNFLWQL